MQRIGEFNVGDYVQIRPDIKDEYIISGLIVGKKRSKYAGQYFTINRKYYVGSGWQRKVRYTLEGLGNTPFGRTMLISTSREENEL